MIVQIFKGNIYQFILIVYKDSSKQIKWH